MTRLSAEHLNYCRSAAKQFMNTLRNNDIPEDTRNACNNAVDLYTASQKFILPINGRLLDDPEFKALDENQPLTLPYPFIALEYTSEGPVEPGFAPSSKRIVFARDREDGIVITVCPYFDHQQVWGIIPEYFIPKTHYLNRQIKDENGNIGILTYGPEEIRESVSDEVGSLLSFLNALQCSNVHIEKSHPKKLNKKIKPCLPFDTYHILTVDLPSQKHPSDGAGQQHRSPREHLRRGHIRRYPNGLKIWIQATFVNAGSGNKVTKDYLVRGIQ